MRFYSNSLRFGNIRKKLRIYIHCSMKLFIDTIKYITWEGSFVLSWQKFFFAL